MPKASPMIRTFNAGEFSPLLQGRVDLERYPASMTKALNIVATPQGPAICRSGTAYVSALRDETKKSTLITYVFSEEQALVLEVSEDRIRFFSEDGVQTYPQVSATLGGTIGAALEITAPGLSASPGDQVFLSGFPSVYNLNGDIATVVSVAAGVYTLDIIRPALGVVTGNAALVYHVDCTYTQDQLRDLRSETSVDIVYLFCGAKPKKLQRYDAYDWRMSDFVTKDGPYAPVNTTNTKLTPSATGNAIPNMTSNTAPSGVCVASNVRSAVAGTYASPAEFLGRQLTYALGASAAYLAFDNSDATYWAGAETQKGYIRFTPAAPFVCDGYTIYAALDNQDTAYLSQDYAPSVFTLEGFNGTDWIVLDKQEEYVLYDGNKSAFIELKNDTAYSAYQLNVTKTTRNGLIEVRVRRLVLRDKNAPLITLTASSVVGINKDAGFKSTDVGRQIRLRGSEGAWRACEIQEYVSATVVRVKLKGEPFLNTSSISAWRLGYWSDTTGWPSGVSFVGDRLWLTSSTDAPDVFAASVEGDYENFAQTSSFGEVLDTSAIVARLNSRRLSKIKWVAENERGVLMGTGSEEFLIAAKDDQGLNARNIKATRVSKRGSASVDPVTVDNQVLYVQRGGRSVREIAYVFEADGYKSPSMSQLANHVGTIPFVQMCYAAEPHAIVWIRRADGSVVGLTYNREESVVGWHRHDFAGGLVESMAVVPQRDGSQDTLWLIVSRQVEGETRRYIERLTRFWDFDSGVEDAFFVDCGASYEGAPTNDVYGMYHLEGEEVYGLADGLSFGPVTVVDGFISLAFPASSVVVGLGFESEGVVPRLENGAADGTAQGKTKRIHSLKVMLWSSSCGEIGVYNSETQGIVYEEIEYPGPLDTAVEPALFSGVVGPITPSPGYDFEGVVGFRRPKRTPLPFNIVAIMPQLHTQDG